MFKKRVLAVLLSVVMTATMLVALPTTAHADTGITLTPARGWAGDTVQVTGTDFSATADVEITFDGELVASVTTDSSGNFTATFTVPNRAAAGNYSVVATDEDNNSDTAVFVYLVPSITLSPAYGPPGTVITVTGVNFASVANTTSITFAGSDVLTGVVTDSSGSFSRSFTVPASATTYGPYTVVAQDTATSTISASAVFTLACCEIVDGGGAGVHVPYTTIDAALAVVANGQTIRLLVDVTLGADLKIDNIKTFTFDTNGKKLDFNGRGLGVYDGSKVNFVGCDKFESLEYIQVFKDGSKAEFDSDLELEDGYFDVEDDVEVIVKGSLTGDGVFAKKGAKITIEGDIVSIDGVKARSGANVTVIGNIDSDGDGVNAQGGAKVTVTGNITARDDDGVEAWGVGTEVKVTGSIEAPYGVYANDGAKVTVTGNITAEEVGALASDDGTEVIVTGNIISEDAGVEAEDGAKVTVTGNITAEHTGVFASGDGTKVYVYGSIVSEYTGVVAEVEVGELEVIVIGNITAGYIGIAAMGEASIYVDGNIRVEEEDNTRPNCGVFVAYGAMVIVDGTITAPNYVGFFILGADPSTEPWFYYLGINDNTTPTLLDGYLQYDDDGKYDMLASFVWVKAATTTVPGTGDGTALWLLLGALMAAALGTGAVFAYRRRRQENQAALPR